MVRKQEGVEAKLDAKAVEGGVMEGKESQSAEALGRERIKGALTFGRNLFKGAVEHIGRGASFILGKVESTGATALGGAERAASIAVGGTEKGARAVKSGVEAGAVAGMDIAYNAVSTAGEKGKKVIKTGFEAGNNAVEWTGTKAKEAKNAVTERASQEWALQKQGASIIYGDMVGKVNQGREWWHQRKTNEKMQQLTEREQQNEARAKAVAEGIRAFQAEQQRCVDVQDEIDELRKEAAAAFAAKKAEIWGKQQLAEQAT